MRPCELGLKCPHNAWVDLEGEIEMICTYPKMVSECLDPEEVFPLVEDCECGICDADSELYKLIDVYVTMMTSEIKRAMKQRDDELNAMMGGIHSDNVSLPDLRNFL